MKELHEQIADAERRVGRFNRIALRSWSQVKTAFNARMLARLGAGRET